MTEDVVDVGVAPAMDDFNNFTIVTATSPTTSTSTSFDQCQKWFQKFYCHQYNPWLGQSGADELTCFKTPTVLTKFYCPVIKHFHNIQTF